MPARWSISGHVRKYPEQEPLLGPGILNRSKYGLDIASAVKHAHDIDAMFRDPKIDVVLAMNCKAQVWPE